MPPRRPMGPPPKLPKGRMKEVLGRLLALVTKKHAFAIVIVFICLLLRAVLSAYGVSLLKELVDDGKIGRASCRERV